ncbi:MAG: sugar phosphate nucleotidyltransferase [Candidatus Hodarchaeota archaeon]
MSEKEKPQVVILCGGFGLRLRRETEFRPKPLVKVGPHPILYHIMKIYSHYGYNRFILCLGYKGEMIKEYFLNYDLMDHDFIYNTKTRDKKIFSEAEVESWEILFADTGLATPTGGRVKKIEKYIEEDNFLLTYGDGLANIDIDDLYKFHLKMNKIGTLTAIHPMSSFGIIQVNAGEVLSFKEKPQLEGLINGGFFVFKKDFFDTLKVDSVLEEAPLRYLARTNQLTAYELKGFWMCMDTFKDTTRLNEMWEIGNTPWIVWE